MSARDSQLLDLNGDDEEAHDPIGGKFDGTFDAIPTWAGRTLVGAGLLAALIASVVLLWPQ